MSVCVIVVSFIVIGPKKKLIQQNLFRAKAKQPVNPMHHIFVCCCRNTVHEKCIAGGRQSKM